MTKEELAALLNGRQMGDEITDDEEKKAERAGLAVVFGYSDDCVEFRGAIEDEAYANGDGEIWLDRDGVKRIDEDDQEVLERHGVMKNFMARARKITAKFGRNENGFDWSISADHIPVAHFEIFEDEGKFCRGIVFSINDLPA